MLDGTANRSLARAGSYVLCPDSTARVELRGACGVERVVEAGEEEGGRRFVERRRVSTTIFGSGKSGKWARVGVFVSEPYINSETRVPQHGLVLWSLFLRNDVDGCSCTSIVSTQQNHNNMLANNHLITRRLILPSSCTGNPAPPCVQYDLSSTNPQQCHPIKDTTSIINNTKDLKGDDTRHRVFREPTDGLLYVRHHPTQRPVGYKTPTVLRSARHILTVTHDGF